MPDVNIVITGSDKSGPATSSAKAGLDNLEKSAHSTNAALGSFKETGNQVWSALSTVATVAAVAAAAAVGGLALAFGDSVSQARESIAASNQLNAVLTSTGGAAGVTSEHAKELANSLQQVTNFGDEATLGAESMLLTFTNIGSTGGVFDRATKTALDMSQALGQDLKSSSIQLGKALNDPIAGVSALSRVGVTFNEQQKDTIKTMVESGNIASAQGLILDELAKEFGGSAEAMADPAIMLQNAFGELKEQVGMFVIPVLNTLARQAMPYLAAATAALGGAVDTFNGYLDKGMPFLTAFGMAIRDLIPTDWLRVWDGFMDMLQGRMPVLQYFGDLWQNVWTSGKQVFTQLIDYMTQNLPIWVATLKGWADAAWQWILDATPKVLSTLGTWAGNIISWLGANLPTFIKTVLEWETALIKWIGDAIPKAINSLTDFIKGIRTQGEGAGTSSFVKMASEWAMTLWKWITDDLIPAVGPAFMDFVGAMLDYGRNLLTALGGLATELGKLLWQWIVEATPPALRKLGEWGQALWGWIGANAPAWERNLAEWAGMAWQWIADVTPIALKALADWGGELWGWIKGQAPTWYDYLKEWAGLAWKWITEIAIPEALKKLEDWGGKLWGWVKENAPKWYEQLKLWGVAAWEWITKIAIPEGLKKLGEWLTQLQGWLSENWPKWSEKMNKAGQDLITWLWDGIEIMWIQLHKWFFSDTAFGRFVGDILQLFGVQMGPAYGVFYDHGKEIAYSLNEGSRFGISALSQTGQDMGNALSGGLQDNMIMRSPSRKMWGYGQDIIAGLVDGITAGVERTRDAMNGAAAAIIDVVVRTRDPMNGAGVTVGQALGQGIATGLKSEAQFVAEQIKSTMELAAATYQGEVDTFARQAAAAAQAKYLAVVNAPKDVDAILRSLGIDPATWHAPINNAPYSSKLPSGSLLPGSSGGAITTPTLSEKTLAEALGLNKLPAAATNSASLLGGISLTATDLQQTADNAKAAQASADKTLKDFIGGFGDFVKSTLDGAKSVFSYLKYQEEDAYAAGNLPGYLSSDKGQAASRLKGMLSGIQGGFADLLGVPVSDLNVTSANSPQLIDRIKGLLKGTSADTNVALIQNLLQSAVDFRNAANFATPNDYYGNVLPTDPRLTGKSTTNNYNITLQGSSNGNSDILGLVQMLGSLQGSATP